MDLHFSKIKNKKEEQRNKETKRKRHDCTHYMNYGISLDQRMKPFLSILGNYQDRCKTDKKAHAFFIQCTILFQDSLYLILCLHKSSCSLPTSLLLFPPRQFLEDYLICGIMPPSKICFTKLNSISKLFKKCLTPFGMCYYDDSM